MDFWKRSDKAFNMLRRALTIWWSSWNVAIGSEKLLGRYEDSQVSSASSVKIILHGPNTFCGMYCIQGFTFLKIPRSYYGILTWEYLEATARIPKDLARSLLEVCERNHVVSIDGAVDLSLERHDISAILDSAEDHCTYEENKEAVKILDKVAERARNLKSDLLTKED